MQRDIYNSILHTLTSYFPTGFVTYSHHQQAIEKVFTKEYIIWKTGTDLHQHTISKTLIHLNYQQNKTRVTNSSDIIC